MTVAIDESEFVDRIAAAVLDGRQRKRLFIRDERMMRLHAILYAQNVARKLPSLFRTDTISI